MLKFNNDHIFTGYLKQLLTSVNLPKCKIYTNDFAKHLARTGKEDPRVIESFGILGVNRPAATVTYLKNNEFCSLQYDIKNNSYFWKTHMPFYYNKDKNVPGVTHKLKSLGPNYDTKTHEYLGDFLRFIRDYYNINLMPLYNCFSNKIYSNIDVKTKIRSASKLGEETKTANTNVLNEKTVIFDSTDTNFRIYAFPVKLFAEYTIAIDSTQGIEMFCGLYKDVLDGSNKCVDLFNKTYLKIAKTMFNQPFVYDKLSSKYWTLERELAVNDANETRLIESGDSIARCDLVNREQDLKLFIKIPTSCSSSITVLEGDFSTYNDCRYTPSTKNLLKGQPTRWDYEVNHSVVNLENTTKNGADFKPISKLQLLAFNTGESYPFADRLIEYLSGSAIIPIDGIADNIKRAQKVMSQNNHYFKIEGVWETQMQKIIYDYMMTAGPIEYDPYAGRLVDKRRGSHPRAGLGSKSTLYDILGYVDKDVEKYYASWKVHNNQAQVNTNIHNVDIYNGLYDI
jgi:hypothetical protein